MWIGEQAFEALVTESVRRDVTLRELVETLLVGAVRPNRGEEP